MRKRKQDKQDTVEKAEAAEDLASALEDQAATDNADEGSGVATESEADVGLGTDAPEAAIERLEIELAEQKDRYLRLAAEFDNFRKRVMKERSDTTIRAKADVAGAILDGLDDLDRVSQLDPETTAARDIIDGVELVERKLFRELESAGLERVGAVGIRFDPNYHEAVSATPSPDVEQEDTIAAVLQVGYRLGAFLLRPARVQVFVENQTEDSED